MNMAVLKKTEKQEILIMSGRDTSSFLGIIDAGFLVLVQRSLCLRRNSLLKE